MAPQWRPLLPDFGHRPVESITLDLDWVQIATPAKNPVRSTSSGDAKGVLLLEDRYAHMFDGYPRTELAEPDHEDDEILRNKC